MNPPTTNATWTATRDTPLDAPTYGPSPTVERLVREYRDEGYDVVYRVDEQTGIVRPVRRVPINLATTTGALGQ